MRAAIGDEIVINTVTLDQPPRRGEVLEVLGADETSHYRVRWQDGHESILYPGPDSMVVPRAEVQRRS
ncbi:DUF1918 domain-containing protein [Pseudonocardia bannensis]|uniref:DUF1918 domain-containing protein n=1 Tax=Pseudonocardia bannensis TaxID=630973 RepID=A0A848DMT9_9PSEU|nr:DUF1918 domain-containing protein [Pseudonocardia bannensis]NMH94062.1 DUF1918 domain-containing protein [Pseudonocardia bannensis]